jgi:small subunit ribosomal protein S2
LTETISLEDLIKAGVQFGHRVSRWNPKMAPYIYGTKNQIHILDLRQTIRGILRAASFLSRMVAAGAGRSEVVLVSTKRQARAIIQREAERCGMHWVTERWLGGTLTNHATIRARLERLNHLEKLEATGGIEDYSKKMISSLRRERRKIFRNLEGIRNMVRMPGAMIVVDVKREFNAVREARKMGLVVIGIVDTNCDPDGVDIPIPGNDDAFRAIEVILKPLADAIMAGRDKRTEELRAVSRESEAPEKAAAGPAPAPSPAAGGPESVTQAAEIRKPAPAAAAFYPEPEDESTSER